MTRLPDSLTHLLTEERKQRLGDMQEYVKKQFVDHPRETGETYMQHLVFTLRMTGKLFYCGTALFVHGVFPFLFKRTASSLMEGMYGVMRTRKPEWRYKDSDPGL